MIRLKTKLALYDLLSKLVFACLLLLCLPPVIERINLRQIDNSLVQNREKIIDLISRIGIEPFISSDTTNTFGSYNILKEEFVSLEKTDTKEDQNYIEISNRLIDDDQISYRVLNYTFLADGQKYLLEIGKSLSSIVQTRKNIYHIILAFLIIVIVITLFTDLIYSQLLLHPLGTITNKLKGISDPALFDKTPVSSSTSDFVSLDNALRDLMEQISGLFQKEKEITINISHELLTPVSVLRSKLENLLLREDLNPEVTVKIEESLKTLYRLQNLVNSLLMIARIESRQYLREDSFSVTEIIKEIIEELYPMAEDKAIKMKYEPEKDLLFSGANRSLVFSMFYNVINNAVKNTGRGGEILLRSDMKNGKYVVTVSDNGRGMTENQKSTLFSRFKSRGSSDDNGTGIGLAITKSIADLHKIQISVISEPGKGTTFDFFFP